MGLRGPRWSIGVQFGVFDSEWRSRSREGDHPMAADPGVHPEELPASEGCCGRRRVLVEQTAAGKFFISPTYLLYSNSTSRGQPWEQRLPAPAPAVTANRPCFQLRLPHTRESIETAGPRGPAVSMIRRCLLGFHHLAGSSGQTDQIAGPCHDRDDILLQHDFPL